MEEDQEDVLLLEIAFSHLRNLEKVSIDNSNTSRLLNVLICPQTTFARQSRTCDL